MNIKVKRTLQSLLVMGEKKAHLSWRKLNWDWSSLIYGMYLADNQNKYKLGLMTISVACHVLGQVEEPMLLCSCPEVQHLSTNRENLRIPWSKISLPNAVLWLFSTCCSLLGFSWLSHMFFQKQGNSIWKLLSMWKQKRQQDRIWRWSIVP